jgi:hypothetical protein
MVALAPLLKRITRMTTTILRRIGSIMMRAMNTRTRKRTTTRQRLTNGSMKSFNNMTSTATTLSMKRSSRLIGKNESSLSQSGTGTTRTKEKTTPSKVRFRGQLVQLT